MYANADKSRAVVFVLGLDKDGEMPVSLVLSGLVEGAAYDISEIDCDVPRSAVLDGRNLKLSLNGPYDSAVFEISRKE